MKFSRSLCILLLAFAAAGSAGATSCAGNNSFLQSVREARRDTAARVVRVRVVPMELFTIVADLPPPPGTFMFEVLEFLDDRNNEGIGTKFSGNGVVHFMLNLPPTGRWEPLPMGSEWILLVREHGGTMRVGPCGAILEVQDNAVHGLVRNPAGTPARWRSRAMSEASDDASQLMPLSDFRRALKALADRKP